MSQSTNDLTAMEALLETLDIEKIEENLFRGVSPKTGWQRVFGGQVIAQALIAAQRTVGDERFVHSLHAYFIRPGDPTTPIVYQCERLRDGISFSTRQVVAVQHGRPIFTMSASFQKEEGGLEHQVPMPGVPRPEDLPDEQRVRAEFLAHAPEPVRRYWKRQRAIEIRPTSFTHYLSSEKLPPYQDVWVRATGPVPDDRRIHAAILAYLSDMTLIDTALYPHGASIFDADLQVASLDHAMWFHRPFSFDDWLLYAHDSPSSSGARGMTRGSLFSRSGELVASVAQEGLIRKRANEQK